MRPSFTNVGRTYFSIIIDALTAGIFVQGLRITTETIGFASFHDPWRTIRASTLSAVPVGILFVTLFYALLSDWARARAIDVHAPYDPSPRGWRFALDVIIVALFLPAFLLARRASCNLFIVLAVFFMACLAWCFHLRRTQIPDLLSGQISESDKRNLHLAKIECDIYTLSHGAGALIYVLALAFLAVSHADGEAPMGATGLLLASLSYWVWELIHVGVGKLLRPRLLAGVSGGR